MTMLVDALLLFVLLAAWGAQATVPWRLAGSPAAAPAAGDGGNRRRRLWRFAAFPLALAGMVAAYALADRNPDAAVAVALVPLRASYPGAALEVLVPALLAAALLGGVAGDRLGAAGERLAAAVGLAAGAAAAWAGELLRTGEGPACPVLQFVLLVGCRLLLMLAGGELLLAPARPRWAAAGGVALLAYLPLLPAELRGVLWSQGLQLTCLAAALLLLSARWLPRVLRPPALAAGLLLAAVVLTQAGHVSQALASGVDYQELPSIR
jgi:hypothetical protein